MTIRFISAHHVSAGTIRCAHCWDRHATHIELSHTSEHDPDEHIVVCEHCAYLAGLKHCNCCCSEPKIPVSAGGYRSKLIPVYAPDNLHGSDDGGRCCEHIGLRLQSAIIEVVAEPTLHAG